MMNHKGSLNMAYSDMFSVTKLNALHSSFTNNYLLKHGNIFTKPEPHANGYPYPNFSGGMRYNPYGRIKEEVLPKSMSPLNFAVKQEKPPTPPASTSPVSPKTPPPAIDKNSCPFPGDQSKNSYPFSGDQSKNSYTFPGDQHKNSYTFSGDQPKNSYTFNGDHSKNSTWILGKQKLSWDNSTVASYNPETKMFRCVVCNAVGFLSRIAEHYLGTHTSAKVFQCLHCPYSSTWSRCVRMHMAKHHGVPNAPPSLWKGQPLLEEIFQLLTTLKTTVDSQGRERLDPELCDKKFICPKCPYTTDRRDLYLRHENIHKEDKPYHCYICFKLFNRADHVKKHFLRIHRGHPYDISLVRRRPPRMSSSYLSNGTGRPNNSVVDSNPASNIKCPSANGGYDAILKDNNERIRQTQDVLGTNHKLPQGFECPFCSWEGADAWCLRRHMNVHLKAFECPICEFKAGKAERLFTHVYKAHKKLVCTKCRFVTDQAQHFETHIKDCCVEMVFGYQQQRHLHSEDSPNDSDTSNSSGIKTTSAPLISPQDLSITPIALPSSSSPLSTQCDSTTNHYQPSKFSSTTNHFQPSKSSSTTNHYQFSKSSSSTVTDVKGSISIIPLHNSISYCYPSRSPPDVLGGVTNLGASVPDVVTNMNIRHEVQSPKAEPKVDIKTELASPVQSSSDSGVADVTSDPSDLDITCWHCGCEFADESSLKTHIELYHRSNASVPSIITTEKKKFSCTLCNFNSDKQRTILDHMRYHTGEVLACRAGYPCAFTTIFNSALSDHVADVHNDEKPRCPHCGLHRPDKSSFIQHYRKCHHSSSCSRCKDVKRSFSVIPMVSSTALVRPYLHHNPYSKTTNAIMPYMHCNAAMSKVAVAIPPLLQSTESLGFDPSTFYQQREHRSRKQASPRKRIHLLSAPSNNILPLLETSVTQLCDINLLNTVKDKRTFLRDFREKLLKQAERPLLCCRMCFKKPVCYRKNVNYLLHCLWFHYVRKFKCMACDTRFRHKYQVLIHKRQCFGAKQSLIS